MIALLFVLFVWSRIGAYRIARDNPPVGAFLEVNGTRMHYVHVPAKAGVADLPPLVFIHGASANLNDQMVPFRPLLGGSRGTSVSWTAPDMAGLNGARTIPINRCRQTLLWP